MEFEWDEIKNIMNIVKHGIDFLDTESVFYDPFRFEYIDIRNDYGEIRHICIGYHKNGNLIFVVYTIGDGVIRIISARKATARERRLYHGYR